jgi:cytoskeleton protein RodZ
MFHSVATFADNAVLPFGQDELIPVAPLRLGPALRDARVAKKLTLEDIAATTRISLRYLMAIENSRFDTFVGAVYALGFVRAYARMVGMSESWAADTLRTEAGWA